MQPVGQYIRIVCICENSTNHISLKIYRPRFIQSHPLHRDTFWSIPALIISCTEVTRVKWETKKWETKYVASAVASTGNHCKAVHSIQAGQSAVFEWKACHLLYTTMCIIIPWPVVVISTASKKAVPWAGFSSTPSPPVDWLPESSDRSPTMDPWRRWEGGEGGK